MQNDPITATEPESGEFRIVLGRKTQGREKKNQKTKNNPKQTGKPSDFLLLHNETLCTGGYVDGVEEKRPQKRSREMQSLR